MKLWQVVVSTIGTIVLIAPVLSACGPSAEEKAYQEAYYKALEEYQQQMEEYQKNQEEYQQALAEGLEEYLKAYQDYQQKLQQKKLEALEE